jgi:hypothetical protein
VAPGVYTPINQCYEVGIGEVNAGQTYDLIVWSATGATGPYTFTATVVP